MKKLIKCFALLLPILIFSCDDIIEEDISNDTIQAIAPSEGSTIEGNTVQFSWEFLDGADDYRLQIFNSNQIFILDSLVGSNTFVETLNPGSYQWRVRGENFAYETPYSFPRNFEVESSDNLSNQTVALQTPSDGFVTNATNLFYNWEQVASADSYDFELVKNFNGQQTVFQETVSQNTSIMVDALVYDEDAEYIWKVRAVNSTSFTPFATRSVLIDRTNPNQPVLVSPEDQETFAFSVNFNWMNGTDSGNVQTVITNTIEFSLDIDFSIIDSSFETSNNSIQIDFSDAGVYYWRVKARDAATNESDFSSVRSFTIE